MIKLLGSSEAEGYWLTSEVFFEVFMMFYDRDIPILGEENHKIKTMSMLLSPCIMKEEFTKGRLAFVLYAAAIYSKRKLPDYQWLPNCIC